MTDANIDSHDVGKRAVILAAGMGSRLEAAGGEMVPKCLLSFGGETLLARHVRLLGALDVTDITVVVGYQAEKIRAAASRKNRPEFVSNPDYELGSVVSLWCAREALTAGNADVILMDADVLYDPAVLARLVRAERTDLFLLDRDFEPGEEPVKLCVADGRLVEFRKSIAPGLDSELVGESVGFFRFSPRSAAELAERAGEYVASDNDDSPYEEVIRDMLLADPDRFGYEDVTGLPWIEIDFPGDLEHAREQVFPRINHSVST